MAERLRLEAPWRAAHRASAMLVGIFALVHLCHHLAGLGSIATHLELSRVLRQVYRHPVAEPLLLLCVTVQWATGLRLLVGRLMTGSRPATAALRLRWWSGFTMAIFVPIHVLAVLQGRARGLDTNFFFAAAGLQHPDAAPFFAVYYGLGTAALVAHLGMAASRSKALKLWPCCGLSGLAVGLCLVLLLSGRWQPFALPDIYRWTPP